MKVSISSTNIQRATQEFQQQTGGNCQFGDNETALFLTLPLGQGYLRSINLRDGLELLIYEYALQQDLIVDFCNQATQHSFTAFTFYVSGRMSSRIPGCKSRLDFTAGQTVFATIPDAATTSELIAGQKITVVALAIVPKLLLKLLENDLNKFSPDWHQKLRNAASHLCLQSIYTTPEMARILQLILHCPHQGGIRRLYLEAKALELLTFCITQLTSHCSKAAPSSWVKPKDVEALHHAKTILLQNITNPPSLAALAQQVGLNERKLQRGFQQIFGTTVFGLLHDHRMEQARQLLEADEMTIEAIANTVGIAHRGYFASAFKRKFGSTPRTYLKRLR
ncbi:MAG: helix-turn-helix transcriptional regulator [Leptolyngbya sp. SIOISBB]|nr:helix-turn-helix transcriptional regulator [Leptolyngbya sp. SIOISBB]